MMVRNKVLNVLGSVLLLAVVLAGCISKQGSEHELDPKNPVTVTIWHYYNGSILNAFNTAVEEFNNTVGMEKGIIVEGNSFGGVTELEQAVLAAAKGEVGSRNLPNVFASYADMAYTVEQMGVLADLDDYLSPDEQDNYLDSYIEEGRIGTNGELRIFPVAKSTEILMLNDTDWEPFAQASGLTYDDLSTMEGIVAVAEQYYEWTDALTPDAANDGKAFFGRDSTANMFIISFKAYETEIFQVADNQMTLNIDKQVMKKIWDCYYVPYINGYFTAQGRYRSDDVKVGEILAYVGSTSSATYFPSEVTTSAGTYPVNTKVLPAPNYQNANPVMVQQGAGMVVTKQDPKLDYASAEFLKWFTDVGNNTQFAARSGYLPVKKAANTYDAFMSNLEQTDISLGEITDQTLQVAFGEMSDSELYTSKAFGNGIAARAVLDSHLSQKAETDRAEVVRLMDEGVSRQEAVSTFTTEASFELWFDDFTAEMQNAVN